MNPLKEKKIYIILPVHNRMDITQKFINYLNLQSYKKFHLILIDDGSADGTSEAVRNTISELTIIRGNGNLWWAGGLQEGFNWIKNHVKNPQDLILIINDDTFFKEDFLKNGVKLISKNPSSIICAERYSLETKNILDKGVKVNWWNFSFNPMPNPEEINCLSTNGIILTVGDFLKTGGFIPEKLPHYASDYEFTIRANRLGLKLKTFPEFKLWSNEKTTGLQNIESKNVLKYLRDLFSIKSAKNPVTLSKFVFLSAPIFFILPCLIRIWTGAIAKFIITILKPNYSISKKLT
jgi:GT2 family glycosyltransferase